MFNKITIMGAGSIGSKTLYSILRTFPANRRLEIAFYNRDLNKAIGVTNDVEGALDTGYLEGKSSRYSQFNHISIIPTSNAKDIANSDLVICTAGVSAAILSSKTREAALPAAYKMIKHFGAAIKEHAPKSTIFMITNPVDIITKLMVEETGFAPEKVIGSGTETDARRFRRFFRYELEKQGFDNIKNILADVVGGHSANNMIIVRDSVRIVYHSSERKISDFTDKKDIAKIEEAYSSAEKRMQTAGFDIIELSNQGASFEPSIQLALMARSYIIGGKNPTNITGSLSLSDDNKYYNISNSVLSVPLKITKGLIEIDSTRFTLSNSEVQRLRNVAQEHSALVEDIKNIPPDFAEKAEAGLRELIETIEGFKRAARNPLEAKFTPATIVKNPLHKSLSNNQNRNFEK